MNCEYVEQLLPLYIGGDLEEDRSRLVSAHLETCTQCALSADEYAGANQLLQRFEPPFFSDAVYAGIRRQVLNEIERKSQAPALRGFVSQFFAPLLQPRVVWIAATLLLVISVAAFYFIANRSNQLPNGQQIAGGNRAGEPNAGAGPNAIRPESNQPIASSSPSSKLSDNLRPAPASVTGKRVVVAGNRSRQREKIIVDRLVQPDVRVSQTSSTPRPLRVEIQTSNRNIRIIWLSNQPPQDGAKETSKGI